MSSGKVRFHFDGKKFVDVDLDDVNDIDFAVDIGELKREIAYFLNQKNLKDDKSSFTDGRLGSLVSSINFDPLISKLNNNLAGVKIRFRVDLDKPATSPKKLDDYIVVIIELNLKKK